MEVGQVDAGAPRRGLTLACPFSYPTCERMGKESTWAWGRP